MLSICINTKKHGNIDIGWCLGKNYQYGAFTSGYTADYTNLADAAVKYNDYDANTETYSYRHYVEMSTGTSDNTKLNNIYDLGGNMHEWTTERGSHKETADESTTYDKKTHAVRRGGSFDSDGINAPISLRFGSRGVDDTFPSFGFRVVLYVK